MQMGHHLGHATRPATMKLVDDMQLLWRFRKGLVEIPKPTDSLSEEWVTFHTRVLLAVAARADNTFVQLQPLPAWLGGSRCLPEHATLASNAAAQRAGRAGNTARRAGGNSHI